MVVRDEDMAQSVERDVRGGELSSDAVTAVDHVGGVVDENDLRRRDSVRAGTRPTSGPEQDQSRLRRLSLAE
jgi:hypothetical protein